MSENVPLKEEIISIVNDRQQLSYNELSDMMFSRGVNENDLKGSLKELESARLIASRSSGGVLTYYILQQDNALRRVLIVEDDKNINKLMALSIGKGFEVGQIYDGGEAIEAVRTVRPDLIILDLMLPHKDGLDICQTIKSDPNTSNTVVILVSAMDPTSNRFKGLKYGADYYIKKPFDPNDLRTLVTIFLKKKGKRFDPLIDLPDEERISKEVERSIKEKDKNVIGTLKVEGLAAYVRKFGEHAGIVILRLISQLIQDSIRAKGPGVFAGFLNSDEFVVAGVKEEVNAVTDEVRGEFVGVLPFILQDAGYKLLELNIDSLFESKEVPRLSLIYEETDKNQIKERRSEILQRRGSFAGDIGAYTYDELQRLFDMKDLDIKITRDANGVRLHVGKSSEKDEKQERQ
ncbi:MAG TPA: response regulator [Candidatus Acidoferrum sp.]|nr:response regulator [Candidatus Acidoferrum sp.]